MEISEEEELETGPSKPMQPRTAAYPYETTPPLASCYVDIRLGSEAHLRPMTGIFFPAGYKAKAEVDIVIYFHGHRIERRNVKESIVSYWNKAYTPYFPLREVLNESGKNVILVAPTLGPRSQPGWLGSKGGLDRYVNQVLAAITAHGPHKGTKVSVGNIVLAAHSGGGSIMRTRRDERREVLLQHSGMLGLRLPLRRCRRRRMERMGQVAPQIEALLLLERHQDMAECEEAGCDEASQSADRQIRQRPHARSDSVLEGTSFRVTVEGRIAAMRSMIIDCHCHAGKGDGLTGPWDTDAPLHSYLRRATEAGIARTVLFAAFHSDYLIANREVARMVRARKDRFYGFAFVHAQRDRGRIRSMLQEAVDQHGFVGIKLHRYDGRITREVCEDRARSSTPCSLRRHG